MKHFLILIIILCYTSLFSQSEIEDNLQEIQIIKVLDSEILESIPYANVVYENQGTITNESGICEIKLSKTKTEIIISAIGYQTDTFLIEKKSDYEVVKLKAANYLLPVIEVNAKKFSAKKIVEAAINRISENYIQQPYNSNLFYRYSKYNRADILLYQSESILKYYDSMGYQKRHWRGAASSRFVQLEQSRKTIDKQNERSNLGEFDIIFVFWTHEPIVIRDKLLSLETIDAYEFKLIGSTKFNGNEVYEIEFNCVDLKEKFVGLPSVKKMRGKLYINKYDYAILRYEEEHIQQYEHKGKFSKRRGHLVEKVHRDVTRVEMFTKNPEGYFISYGKVNSIDKYMNVLLSGEIDSFENKHIQEYQFFDITTKDIYTLDKNLMEIETIGKYDPEYWKQFNILLDDQ